MPGDGVLTLLVSRGRRFPPSLGPLRVTANFARDARATELCARPPGAGDAVRWNAEMVWRVEAGRLRRAVTSRGLATCKVVAEGAGGERLGWVVIDLRAAKMNALRTDYEGEWLPLAGPKPNLIHSPPELFLSYKFEEEKCAATPTASPPPCGDAAEIDRDQERAGRDAELDFGQLEAAAKRSEPFVLTGRRGEATAAGKSSSSDGAKGVRIPPPWESSPEPAAKVTTIAPGLSSAINKQAHALLPRAPSLSSSHHRPPGPSAPEAAGADDPHRHFRFPFIPSAQKWQRSHMVSRMTGTLPQAFAATGLLSLA
ncbi:unnamed protein product [Ostreobium quekettii]|uniref:Uncharacterized protein n=1 Tax=Ostreobium quekettii TaxID=121088 RepID=A0A8S1IYZ0_9CHLO|nr:unnamed protein product [Ostreobium quekettii]